MARSSLESVGVAGVFAALAEALRLNLKSKSCGHHHHRAACTAQMVLYRAERYCCYFARQMWAVGGCRATVSVPTSSTRPKCHCRWTMGGDSVSKRNARGLVMGKEARVTAGLVVGELRDPS